MVSINNELSYQSVSYKTTWFSKNATNQSFLAYTRVNSGGGGREGL